MSQDASQPSLLLWGLLFLFTTASATQDIAIDAYAVDVATPQDIGSINGTRVSAGRIGLLVSGGGMLFLAEFTGWSWICYSTSSHSSIFTPCSYPAVATTSHSS